MKDVFEIDPTQIPRAKIPQYDYSGSIVLGYLSSIGQTWQYYPRIDDAGNIIVFNFNHDVRVRVSYLLWNFPLGSEIQFIRAGTGNVLFQLSGQDNTLFRSTETNPNLAYLNQNILAKFLKINNPIPGQIADGGEWLLYSLHTNPFNSFPT